LNVARLERTLISDEFSIEQEDEALALQIHSLLQKANLSDSDEDELTKLTSRMLKDEKRRKKIIQHILHLQKSLK